MPGNISGLVITALFMGIGVFAIVSILIRFVKNRYAPVKAVKAIVIDKNIVETISKYSGKGKHEKYVIVFSIEGKKKSFYVSKFSYHGYKINEKGTLKYKGDKLISFQ